MLKTSLILILLAAYAHCAGVGENDVYVPDVGYIEGVTSTTAWSGRKIWEFRGVPYAENPEGPLRFQYPVKINSWDPATYKATEYGPACPQPSAEDLPALAASILQPEKWVLESRLRRKEQLKNRLLGEESCLTLDIYTPTLNSSAMLPVMVYFHGGMFMVGSSAGYRPGYLLEHDIVLVVPQYRLGPFGYFYLNDPLAPGNMGLADQAMALRWVRDNIEAFGGDPSMITAGGSSSGGASASLHMLNVSFTSEMSRLIDRVISTSGSSLSLWGIETNSEDAVDMSMEFAALLGCSDLRPSRVVECMLELNTTTIVDMFVQHQTDQWNKGFWGGAASMPVVQTGTEGVEVMVRFRPQDVLEKENGDNEDYLAVPMLMGANEHEGIFALDIIYPYFLEANNYLNDRLYLKNELIVDILNSYGVNENSRVMADACTRRYFNRTDLGDFTAMTPGLIDFLGVAYFKGSVFRQAELHSLREKAYLYSFEYFGQHTRRQPFNGVNASVSLPGGITHGDDLIYLFPHEDYALSGLDLKVSKRLVEVYANFITHGDPTPSGMSTELPTWLSYSRGESNYMHIENNMVMKTAYRDSFTTTRKNGLKAPIYPNAANTLIAMHLLLFVTVILNYFM